jgi:hypothetical protein
MKSIRIRFVKSNEEKKTEVKDSSKGNVERSEITRTVSYYLFGMLITRSKEVEVRYLPPLRIPIPPPLPKKR